MSLPPSETDLVKIFRGLIVADIVIAVVSMPLAMVSGVLAEAALREAGISEQASSADAVVAAFSCMILVVAIPAQIVSWIGLFNFRSWARWLYLGTVVATLLMAIPIGYLDFSYSWGLPGTADRSDPGAGLSVARRQAL